MLLQNRTLWYSLGYQASSSAFAQRRNQMGMNANNNLNRYDGEGKISRGSGMPHGYRPPYGWLMACEPKYGAGVTSIGDVSLHSSMDGRGTITNNGQALNVVRNAVVTIQGLGGMTSSASAILNAAVTMAGSGDFDGALGAISGAICNMYGIGGMTIEPNGEPFGIGYAQVDVSPFTPLSPQALAANVWNSLLADFAETGTMGKALADAGGAGNPWGAIASTNQDPGTMGEIVNKKLLKTGTFIALK